jgi:AcrR family transcriptional regulator
MNAHAPFGQETSQRLRQGERGGVGDRVALRINAPSLYAAFGSKEQLFREAVALYNESSPTERAIREAPTARDAVENMLRENARAYADPGNPPGCLVVFGAVLGPPGNAGVRDYLAEVRRNDRLALKRRIADDVAEGILPRNADPEAIAEFYVTVLHGLSLQAARRSVTSRTRLDRRQRHAGVGRRDSTSPNQGTPQASQG